jgi:hypothetical protein
LQLRDIHLPPPPPWWPPAPGWWLLAAVVLGLLVLGTWWLARAARRRRQARALSALVDAVGRALASDPAPDHLAELSALLRRVALRHHPRHDVAALSGAAWLAFLDRTGGAGAFAAGPGRVLGDAVYHGRLDDGLDVAGLMQAVQLWVRRNSGGRK